MRDLIFISHATPQQNEFTKWLALQLANAGYKVWTDVTKLIGGEATWPTIEEAIRHHCAKFLFVLSHDSNQKDGCLKELGLADTVSRKNGLQDFVIPLHFDSLPHSDMNVYVLGHYAIEFRTSWADGLRKLLDKLEKDAIPKNTEQYNPSTVGDWWRAYSSQLTVNTVPENLLSNWLRIIDIPQTMLLHRYGAFPELSSEPFPAHVIHRERLIVSFATSTELDLSNVNSVEVATEDAITGHLDGLDSNLSYGAVIVLLKKAWIRMCKKKGLPTCDLSNREECVYFTQERLAPRKLISFNFPDVGSGLKGLTGSFRGKFWHFGLSVNLQILPVPAYVLHPRVVFSGEDGNLMPSRRSMNRIRRSACKDWWNDDWRDRMLASLSWLIDGRIEDSLELRVSNDKSVKVQSTPLLFGAPVSYADEDVVPLELDDDSEELFTEADE